MPWRLARAERPGSRALPFLMSAGSSWTLQRLLRKSFNSSGRRGDGMSVSGESAETTQTIRIVPTTVDYWVCTTFPRERRYRAWVLKKLADRPLLDAYTELARRFPHGLAEVPPLPEEISGAVTGEMQS